MGSWLYVRFADSHVPGQTFFPYQSPVAECARRQRVIVPNNIQLPREIILSVIGAYANCSRFESSVEITTKRVGNRGQTEFHAGTGFVQSTSFIRDKYLHITHIWESTNPQTENSEDVWRGGDLVESTDHLGRHSRTELWKLLAGPHNTFHKLLFDSRPNILCNAAHQYSRLHSHISIDDKKVYVLADDVDSYLSVRADDWAIIRWRCRLSREHMLDYDFRSVMIVR